MLIASYDVVDVMGYRRDVAVLAPLPLVATTDLRSGMKVSFS